MSQPAGPGPLPPSQRVAATLVIAMSNFMVVLDMTIANVSVPHISGSLAASPTQGTWIITSYAVAEAVIVPLTGWLATRLGAVRLFVTAILGFAFASLLCSLSTSLGMLVAARIFQGLCGGPIMPLAQTLLLSSYPREKAGSAMGIWAMTTLLAPIMGPLLGGWITDNYEWEWIFYINVPVGLLAAGMVWNIYRTRETPRQKVPVDVVGLGLLLVWVGALQLVLDKGRELDWFESPFILALAITSVVGFGLFLIWELTAKNPIVDLRVFANRTFTVSVMSLSVLFGVFFSTIVLMPLWLQTYQGYSALNAGMATAPMGVFSLLLAPLIGAALGKVDARIFVSWAILVFVTVFLWRSNLTADASFSSVVIPQFVLGFGLSAMFLPLTALSMSEIPGPMVASAAGLQNFMRTLFGAFGTAFATSYWETGVTRHHAILTESVTRYDQPTTDMLARAGAAGLDGPAAHAMLDRLIQQHAAVMSLTDYYLIAAVLVASVLPIVWIAHRQKAGMGMGGGH
jgi:DHA2 family multidrug resistance protein